MVDYERSHAAGGIVALAVLAGAHRGPITADFRHIYHTSASEAGSDFWILTRELLGNRESWFHAAVAGWTHPVSGAQIVLMDLYDRIMQAHFKPPHTPYPREWNAPKRPTRSLSDKEAMAILRPHKGD